MKTIKLYDEITVSNLQCSLQQYSTLSVGGGGMLTVSASSTLKGSSTLLESVVRYLPFFIASDTLLLQKSENKETPILLLLSLLEPYWIAEPKSKPNTKKVHKFFLKTLLYSFSTTNSTMQNNPQLYIIRKQFNIFINPDDTILLYRTQNTELEDES